MKQSLGANTIALPLPAWVICAYDKSGRANAMTASWAGVCCSKPPCVYFAVRESRYTHACVAGRRAFTVNVPGFDQAQATDYFGTASGRTEDKIAKAGLTAVKAQHVDAPFLDEFPLVMECKVINTVELGSHTMFIGEILDVKCDANMLAEDGRPDPAKIQPFIYSPANSTYYQVTGALGKGYELGRR